MPWKERTVSQMRKDFVERVLAHEKSKAALCREYGISRPTGDKWIARYLAGDSLDDMDRKPHSSPNQTPPEVEKAILDFRKQQPAIGAVKIRRILENGNVENLPSVKTVNNILKRNGMITREASLAATPYKRFEKSECNEMWQADFKGHFALGDGKRCHPLNIIDDKSRFNLCCKAMKRETFEDIRPVMIRLFTEFGMPFSFLCDNGNPWGTVQSTGFSRFEVWLMELGVLTLHGRPLHPQTQGKEERFNGSLKRELLRYRAFATFEDAQTGLDEYREFYNNIRPHYSLNLDVPAKHYSKSNREYSAEIPTWEYPEGSELRRVKSSGYFNWGGQGYFLSEAFGDKEIAVRRAHAEHCINLYFRQFHIGRIDTERRVFTFKRAYLIDGDPRPSKPVVGGAK